jgi:hypothetical protein
MAEAHPTINQKAEAIAADMAVEAVVTSAAVAEAKTAAEGVAVMLRQQLWQRWGQATAGADNNQPKSGRNGGQGGGNVSSHGRGEDSGRGGSGNIGTDSFGNDGAGNSGGKQQSTKKRQNGSRGGSGGGSHDQGNGGSRNCSNGCSGDKGSSGCGDSRSNSGRGGSQCGGNVGRNIIMAVAAKAAAVAHW